MTLQRKCNIALLCATFFVASCDNPTSSDKNTLSDTKSDIEVPSIITYSIVNQFPHDPKAFTEGLEYVGGYLYESTGQYGVSELRKVELATGKVIQSVKMDKRYFGEGITILNDKVYQLTYREGKCLVYNLATFKEEATYTFSAVEGWGMTNNGTQLIYSDGSNKLYFVSPEGMNVVKQLSVTDERGPVQRINELELINGYIYANQWQVDVILKIDTTTGRVVARADMSSIRQQGGIPPNTGREDAPEVLNGIAWDAAANRVFITGKNWPKVFEVKLDN